MRFAKDAGYKSFYSTHGRPLMAELGQPVYVEVFVVKHEDKDLILLLGDCWATPTENPNDLQRWNLIVKGCPFSGDSHRTVVLSVASSKEPLRFPSLHKRFEVKMFSFVKPKEDENWVYFHCNVELCKGLDCSRPCTDGRRKLRTIASGLRESIHHSVISGGPIIFFT
ncbi:zona pellucida sperm-binding protein 4-like [Brachionichthys hirsutus]|uniref:zona pellucida sperm-binding protein 4-like n=1 Tax=Brachionichthys hirsutus TaxID=412623 RepID=UPI003604ECF4